MRIRKLYALAMLLLLCTSAHSVYSKNLTVEQRQMQLMKEINAGQKAKELTTKEAKKLRSELADVAREKVRLKAAGVNQKLSADDTKTLEEMLNNVSLNLKKQELEKRVKNR